MEHSSEYLFFTGRSWQGDDPPVGLPLHAVPLPGGSSRHTGWERGSVELFASNDKICAMQAGLESCHSSWGLPKVFLVSGGRETSVFQCLQLKVKTFDHHDHMRHAVPHRSFEKTAILKVLCWRTLESPVEKKFYCRFFFPFHQTGSLSSQRFSLGFFWLMHKAPKCLLTEIVTIRQLWEIWWPKDTY